MNTAIKLVLGMSVLVFSSACGEKDVAPPQKVDAATSNVAPNAPEVASPPKSTQASSEDPMSEEVMLKRGKVVFFQCRSCHTLDENQVHMTGPHLYNLFGRTAGVIDGFNFSKKLTESKIVWNEETLDKWIKSPNKYVPGNVMAYAGLRKESDRQALIAYLKSETN